ncbi:hypothetical protein A3F08_00630 [Candidatus Berkelbacteria bacterium RIFCSPHIGHO2_12_FULL_36_9]|uniref:ASCH domain-containing protein n=1 Tax=Candidatus Berkelbacteria bacterium RIFCSPHIGHO2_12_FULL_36_9 TaxID=1797469 RepID=A0A1F5EF97_9BACT|nr:MAG: hypothetical protein A3F08_00630 [Candidatus Berkelbacteria bacterium RIFCSPHIGHO2_12_FULL_36_9]
MKHLAIFVGDAIEKILKGEKTIEGRFNIDKILPYNKIQKGDEVLLKQSGRDIIGVIEVENVLFYENLDGEAIGKLRKEYGKELAVGDDFWRQKAKARYASLIFLKCPKRFLAPLKSQKHDRRTWVLLEK